MNAHEIVAGPGTITGSIGVFSGKFSLRGLYETLGLSHETIRRGRNSAIFSEWEPWSEEERARIRSINESFYRTFIAKAAEGRDRSPEQIDEVAQGRVWTGEQAAGNGLVDRLGGLTVALDVARERAGIAPGQPLHLVVLPERPSLLQTLFRSTEDDTIVDLLGPDGAALVEWAVTLSNPGPLARLPFRLCVR